MPIALSRRGFFSLGFNQRSETDEHWITVHRTAMACRVEVKLPSSASNGIEAAREALDEADRLESLLTVFRDTSEVTFVNRHAAEAPVRVSPQLFELLRLSAVVHADTGGAFDVTSGPLSRVWGFVHRNGRVPDPIELDRALACVGMNTVALDEATRTVRFARCGIELNFGSIGKGFVLDHMAGVLRRRGIRHALLSAGSSSVVALGGRDGGWPIDLRPRRTYRLAARLRLHGGAIGTSGAGEQFFEAGGVRYGHVIDPRTGVPASGVVAATVVAGSGAVADAVSTALLVGGADLARRYCDAHRNTLAIVVTDNEKAPDSTLGREGCSRAIMFGGFPGALMEMS